MTKEGERREGKRESGHKKANRTEELKGKGKGAQFKPREQQGVSRLRRKGKEVDVSSCMVV